MNLYSIHTGSFKLDGGAMFGVVPKVMWQKFYPADEKNLCPWAMRSLLIEEGDRLILIDTGLGNKQSEKFFSFFEPHGKETLEGSLAQHGFKKDDVTDVLLTHLHFDHCGDAIIRNQNGTLVPNFKNATYWSNKSHWDWAVNPNPRERASFLKENILPIEESGQLQFADEDTEIMEGLRLKLVHGHTESMIIPHIDYNGKTLVYMADLLPSPHHIPIPYVMSYDIRPLQTIDEKEAFLSEAYEKEYILFFEHDKEIECCNLQKSEKGIRMKDSFDLKEIL